MTTCGEAEDLIERRLDGETTEAQELALTDHLAGCAACSQQLERETTVDAALAAVFAGAEPSPQLGPRIHDRVRREASGERWGWITDGLNAVGGLVMFAFATRVLGPSDPRSVATLLLVAGGALAVGLYPLWLARLGGPEEGAPPGSAV